ncbi:MAG: hypothetical protein JWQ28_2772 [Pedobacter sp.]|nr:hypothetical protein [Pedobacter sp.]
MKTCTKQTQHIRQGLFIIPWLTILLPACGGLRNVERLQKSSEISTDSTIRTEQVAIVKQQKTVDLLLVKGDSLNSNYKVQIWPKGKFSYNAERGFEGTADRISITGDVKQRNQSIKLSRFTEGRDQLLEQSTDIQKTTNVVQKSAVLKKQISWKTILGYFLIAFCLIIVILIFRVIRRRFTF